MTTRCHTCGCKLSAREETEYMEARGFDASTKPLCDECYEAQEGMEHGEAEPTWDSDSGL